MMKRLLSLLLLLAATAAGAQETLRTQLDTLQRRFAVQWVYDADLDLARPYTGPGLQGLPLERALDTLLDGSGLVWKRSGSHIVLKPAPKKGMVSGYVRDVRSGEPLIGAGVQCGPSGTVTNVYGFYTLPLESGRNRLTFSYVGYASRAVEVEVRGAVDLTVDLRSDAQVAPATVTARTDVGIGATLMGALEIQPSLIRNTPVLFGEADVLKTLQMMPGVQAGSLGMSGIFVRGGGGDENLVLMDGVPLYGVNHMLGLFSVFTPEAVKKVTLYKGAVPARFGGRASSVVDVRMNDGDMKEWHGSLTAGLLAEKVHLEGPLRKDRTAVSLSARGLHTVLAEPLLRLAKVPYNYFFYDVNAKLTHRFSERDIAYVSFYHGRDFFLRREDEDVSEHQWGPEPDYLPYDSRKARKRDIRVGWGNTAAAASWNHTFSSGLFAHTALTWNRYSMRTRQDGWRLQDDLDGHEEETTRYRLASGIRDLGLATDWDWRPSARHIVRFGGGYTLHRYTPESAGSVITSRDTVRTEMPGRAYNGHEAALYAEDDMVLGERFSLQPGLHLSLFHTGGRTDAVPEPRLSARWASGAWSVKGGYARMSQYVHLLTTGGFSMPTDIWVPITGAVRPLVSDQVSLGGYWTGVPGWEFSAETWCKTLRNVVEYIDPRLFYVTTVDWEGNVAMGRGRSFGVELLAERKAGRTTGWLGYTWSRATRIFPDGSINRGRRYPDPHDRPHKVNLVVNHRFSGRVDLSAAWTFASGQPVSYPTRVTEVQTVDGGVSESWYYPDRNNYRVPPTHRLDVSVNFHKRVRRGERTWNIGVYNLYGRNNPDVSFTDRRNDRRIILVNSTLLLCIPAFSYTWRF